MRTENGKTLAAISGLALIVAVLSMLMGLLPRPNQPRDRGTNQTPAKAGLAPITPSSEGLPANRVGEDADTSQEQKTEPGHFGGWFTKENAPDWLMVFVSLGGFYFAWRQIREAKSAVMLTERADVMVDALGLAPAVSPLTTQTEIQIRLKNYGPTRASEVTFRRLVVTIGTNASEQHAEMPISNIAASDEISGAIRTLGKIFDAVEIDLASRGKKPMTLLAELDYRDVFDELHPAKFEAVYTPFSKSGFRMKERQPHQQQGQPENRN